LLGLKADILEALERNDEAQEVRQLIETLSSTDDTSSEEVPVE